MTEDERGQLNIDLNLWMPIINGMATLRDMQEYYDMDDLADMLEALTFKNVIEQRAINKASKK
jgi:hypothetical protein